MKKKIIVAITIFLTLLAVNAQEITINGTSYVDEDFDESTYRYTNNTLTLNNYEGGEIISNAELNIEIVGTVNIMPSSDKEAITAPKITINGEGELHIESTKGFFKTGELTINNIKLTGTSTNSSIISSQTANINNVEMNVQSRYLVIGGNNISFLSSKVTSVNTYSFQHDASGTILFDKCELDITSIGILVHTNGKIKFIDTFAKLTSEVYVASEDNLLLIDESKFMYTNGVKELEQGTNYNGYLTVYVYPPENGGDNDNPDNPPTGDNIIYWLIMLFSSVLLIIISLLALRKYYGKSKISNSKL